MIKVLDNVYDLVTLNMEQRFSERVALRFYDKETDEVTAVHYKDYARDIRRAVNYFQSTIPDIKGKKICLLNKNSYEYAVNTFGIILAGGVLVLLNQHKSWDELSYELGLVEPAAILTDGDDYGTKEQLQAAYGSILRPMDGFRAYEPVAEMPRCIGHDDLMILMFTSGTTGRSKGVMLSERNFFSVMRAHVQIGERMMEYKHDPELVVSQYTVLPMFHLGAFICLFSWAHGGWALNISGDIRNFYKEIRRMPSQVMAVVPVIMNSLHKDVMRGRKERLGELNTFGIILAGGVLVLLNQHKSWDELSYELGLVEPAAILTDGDDYGTKEQLQAAYGSILRPMDGFRAYEPVAEMPRCIGHDDLMILMFTSGTTGRSKGVMLSERNFFSVMRAHVQIGERMMEYKHDPELVVSQYTVLPMFHLGAFICLFSWAHGGWALNISGDIRNFYKEIRRMPSQVMAVVPVIMNSLHKDVMRGRKERLGELWVPICSSAMFDPQVMLDMATNGMFVVQTYGATETCGDGIINYAQDAKHIGAVGQGNDYLDYKLEPDGELCIRGDSIMLGYYKDPEATAAVIDKDGWFHTGDLARVDEDGYYYITGRKKNLIILDSGENVSPEELEGMLEKCPAVQECIVKELGKKIGVVVYCEKEHQQTVRDFIAQMNRTVPLYKRIGVVEFSETPLPRNGVGKLVRK